MIITEKHYLSIAKDWHFRVDGNFGTLFHYNSESLVFHRFTKENATALLLMNGLNTLGEVKRIMKFLFPKLEIEEIKNAIESILKSNCDDINPTNFIEVSDHYIEFHRYNLKKVLKKC